MIWLGLAIMIVSEAATLAGVEPFASWNTPICWTGFIVFADAIVFRARGNSWIRSAPGEFAALAAVSIPLWVVFEGYNLIIRNWYYTGLPENTALRLFGYAWSFATIWPAIFEAAELFAVMRRTDANCNGVGSRFQTARGKRLPTPLQFVGAAMLAAPFFVSDAIATYLAAPVWIGFILFLDPINDHLGAESIAGDLRSGRGWDRTINLILSGFLCGILWEFWNYWSRAKWHYTVPIMARLKIFEMPVPGYLGFPAFALECFTMYVCVRRLVAKHGRTIGL